VVNDGVMGGRSQSTFTLNADGNGLFQGKVSLENNGGFASVHYRFNPVEAGNSTNLVIRLKGDGKKYQARIYANTSDSYSYIAFFETSGEWQSIEIPLKSMYPSFRGRKLDKPNFSEGTIEEIAILIGNKKAEPFQLEINKLELK
jgi:NADH dehydrogenase [ubiquinone] 1 alpha subcomplex assembly factor 1